MPLIHITNGLLVRDQKKKENGHLHSIIWRAPDGSFIEQSKDHHQIIQRRMYPNGRIILTYFAERGGTIVQIEEEEHFLPAPTS